MRLKKQSDYALRVLIYLNLNPEAPATVKEIADSFDISQNHLTKVVQSLRKLSYVHTVRGHNGGIWLAQPAESIKLGEVLRRLGEDGEVAECFILEGNCKISRLCNLKHVLSEAAESFFQVLDRYTLADIAQEPKAMAALLNAET